MTGEKFKALALEQQVEYINSQLEQGETVDNIRIALGVGKNYIGNNFSKGGYKKDKDTGLYILVGEAKAENKVNSTKKANRKVLESKMEGDRIKVLETKIEGLETNLEQIKAMLNTIVTKGNNVNTTIGIIDTEIKTFETDNLVSRSYKVDADVQQAFKVFCRVNGKYNISDILSNAMLEYMEKFNK